MMEPTGAARVPHAPFATSHEVSGSVRQPLGGSCHGAAPSGATPQMRAAASGATRWLGAGMASTQEMRTRCLPSPSVCGMHAAAQWPLSPRSDAAMPDDTTASASALAHVF